MYRLRVREVLQEKGRTQSWLARKSGVQDQLISKMLKEPDSYRPSYTTLAQVAKALRVPMEALFEELPDPEDEPLDARRSE
ncbi:helix-turn-helix domain-containing protein [Thermogemmatispora carboxidivorans]|uniref:helix-turn-helix domain-containing protein n=1 Tax=Thermogemmatispora carboxidivorans TaxID=1382306 RepID=UPI00069A4CD3